MNYKQILITVGAFAAGLILGGEAVSINYEFLNGYRLEKSTMEATKLELNQYKEKFPLAVHINDSLINIIKNTGKNSQTIETLANDSNQVSTDSLLDSLYKPKNQEELKLKSPQKDSLNDQ